MGSDSDPRDGTTRQADHTCTGAQQVFDLYRSKELIAGSGVSEKSATTAVSAKPISSRVLALFECSRANATFFTADPNWPFRRMTSLVGRTRCDVTSQQVR